MQRCPKCECLCLCSARARNLKCWAEGAETAVEDPLHGTNIPTAFCFGEGAPRPPSPGQPHLTHPHRQFSPSNPLILLDKAQRGHILLLFLKCFLKPTAEDLYLYQSLTVPHISLDGSLWEICFSMLATSPSWQLSVHSVFVPHRLSKHICNCSYVTKCNKQAGDTWADADSWISPHCLGLGNKICTQRAQSHQGTELPTFSKVWSCAYRQHHMLGDGGRRSSAGTSLVTQWTSTSLHHLSSFSPFFNLSKGSFSCTIKSIVH